MPTSVPEDESDYESRGRKKLTTFPINLQSLLQTITLMVGLVATFVYADRRITTLELSMQELKDKQREHSELLHNLQEKQSEALINQRLFLEFINDSKEERRAKDGRR